MRITVAVCPKCTSCHESIIVITRRYVPKRLYIYIKFILQCQNLRIICLMRKHTYILPYIYIIHIIHIVDYAQINKQTGIQIDYINLCITGMQVQIYRCSSIKKTYREKASSFSLERQRSSSKHLIKTGPGIFLNSWYSLNKVQFSGGISLENTVNSSSCEVK